MKQYKEIIFYIHSLDAEEELDFTAGIDDFVSKLSLPIKSTKLIAVQKKTREWLKSCQERQDSGERVRDML